MRLVSIGAVVSSTITSVAATAALSLPATSVTAAGSSATVTSVSAVVSAVIRVISTVAPLFESAVVVSVAVPDLKVILVRSTVPMVSLKVRMTFVPSLEAWGRFVPILTSVGSTASTLLSLFAATASWVRTRPPGSVLALVNTAPLSERLFASIAIPSVSVSPATMV